MIESRPHPLFTTPQWPLDSLDIYMYQHVLLFGMLIYSSKDGVHGVHVLAACYYKLELFGFHGHISHIYQKCN